MAQLDVQPVFSKKTAKWENGWLTRSHGYNLLTKCTVGLRTRRDNLHSNRKTYGDTAEATTTRLRGGTPPPPLYQSSGSIDRIGKLEMQVG